ncbi:MULTISPECIES: sugar transferase [Roseobacteraceae]|uniref:Putative sugar transferase EpsL n=1 Tax=Pseudosulfitobacter pseudonitzschiae TaxID=1402135 RepID=A0A221K4A5_9RHOB|nr:MULTISPECIES: sugar transferase [Roseobacteraceae]ASM73838.1 putative sugar transferase EpsL [Pseudosulfitobacter pseudonitzschiae]
MTWHKRIFDLFFASLLVIILGPIILWLVCYILIKQGRPLFYVSERMKTPTQPFGLWKFRTMTVVNEDAGVSGGYKQQRITPLGAKLRAKRLDEFPQLWNILRGDLSFVGPRPPLREYVERFPELYSEVLKSRPGVTGLATIMFHKHEDWLLARCETPAETDDIYTRICIPRKARLDIMYQRNQSTCWDIDLVFQTIGNLFRRRRSITETSDGLHSGPDRSP